MTTTRSADVDDGFVARLRAQATGVAAHPGTDTWPGVTERIPRERRRRAVRRAAPPVFAAVVVAGALLAGSLGGVDDQTSVVPVVTPPDDGGQVLTPPAVVTFTDAQRVTAIEQCGNTQATFGTLPPGGATELIAAVRDGDLVAGAIAGERFVVMCEADAGADGRPTTPFDAVGFDSRPADIPGGVNYLAVPTEPVEVYTTRGGPTDGNLQEQTVVGRVSPKVARLVAFVEGGPSREVPIQAAGGFVGVLRWTGQSDARDLSRLQLRAYDHAGAVVHTGPVVPRSDQPVETPVSAPPPPGAVGVWDAVGPEPVTLSPGDRAASLAACVTTWQRSRRGATVAGDRPELLGVARNGSVVVVAIVVDNQVLTCRGGADSAGRPILTGLEISASSSDPTSGGARYRHLIAGTFDLYGSSGQQTDGRRDNVAIGRVSAEVKRLEAALGPDDRRFTVPIDESGGFVCFLTFARRRATTTGAPRRCRGSTATTRQATWSSRTIRRSTTTCGPRGRRPERNG